MSWTFIIAIVINLIALVISLYFLIVDSAQSISSSNGALSLVTLLFCVWVGISFYLYHHGHPTIASIMAWIPAVPLLVYGIVVLIFVILKPDMK